MLAAFMPGKKFSWKCVSVVTIPLILVTLTSAVEDSSNIQDNPKSENSHQDSIDEPPLPNYPIAKTISIKVVNKLTRTPIEGAKISWNIPGQEFQFIGKSNEHGFRKVHLPELHEDTSFLQISAQSSELVDKTVKWSKPHDSFLLDTVPANYVIELSKGLSGGGIVRDERRGNPLENIAISIK